MDIHEFYERIFAPRIPLKGAFVEVGLFLGRTITAMGRLRPDLELYGVDSFDGSMEDGRDLWATYGSMRAAFDAIMQRDAPDVLKRVRLHVGRSDAMLRQFPDASVDAIYIDGGHSYPVVVGDCVEALRIVKPGGIIGGHDFNVSDVERAVLEVLGGVELAPEWPPGRSWWRFR